LYQSELAQESANFFLVNREIIARPNYLTFRHYCQNCNIEGDTPFVVVGQPRN